MAASEVAQSNCSEWECPHSWHAPTVGSPYAVGMRLQSGRHGPPHIGSPDAYTCTGTHHANPTQLLYLVHLTCCAEAKSATTSITPLAAWERSVLLSYCNTVTYSAVWIHKVHLINYKLYTSCYLALSCGITHPHRLGRLIATCGEF